MESIHVTHLTYSALLEDWSFSIKAKYARLRTSRGRRMRLRESFFCGPVCSRESKVLPSTNYNKIENEGQTSNLHFIVISLRADDGREVPRPTMSKIYAPFQSHYQPFGRSGDRTSRLTERIIPYPPIPLQLGIHLEFTHFLCSSGWRVKKGRQPPAVFR